MPTSVQETSTRSVYTWNPRVNSSWCAQYFPKPKFKTSEFGAEKGLLIEKAPTEKTGDLEMPQIQLTHWTEFGFLSTKRGMGKGDLG